MPGLAEVPPPEGAIPAGLTGPSSSTIDRVKRSLSASSRYRYTPVATPRPEASVACHVAV